MNVTKRIEGDFVIITVSHPDLPDKNHSVLAESIYDGTTTLQEQVDLAMADAEKRLAIKQTVAGMINDGN